MRASGADAVVERRLLPYRLSKGGILYSPVGRHSSQAVHTPHKPEAGGAMRGNAGSNVGRTFRWRGRDPNEDRLMPTTFASGLDDYPRALFPSDDEVRMSEKERSWL